MGEMGSNMSDLVKGNQICDLYGARKNNSFNWAQFDELIEQLIGYFVIIFPLKKGVGVNGKWVEKGEGGSQIG